MVKLLVIADDFTGALDTGVQFAVRGIPTVVTVDEKIFNGKHTASSVPYEDMQVVVVDLESRHIPAAEAAQKVAAIVKHALQGGVEYFYKKTDSTLRGNIGAELSALLEASGNAGGSLVFVPAYPKTGRITENGYQLVNGTPLHLTGFAKDPLNPINDSFIPTIIKSQSDCNVVVCKLCREDPAFAENQRTYPHNTQQGAIPVNNRTANPQEPKSSIIVFDASTDQDLLDIAKLLKKTDHFRITAGCAGFAAVLPDLLELNAKEDMELQRGLAANNSNAKNPIAKRQAVRKPVETMSPEPLYAKKTLVLCGSLNEASLEQVRYAESKGWPSIAVPPEMLLYGGEDEIGLFASNTENMTIRDILKLVSQNDRAILKTISNYKELSACIQYGESRGLDKREIHLRIAHNIGLLVKLISAQADIGTFIVFGGDTALGIVGAMEWGCLVPEDEILPGVVISQVLKYQPHQMRICEADGFASLHEAVQQRDTYLVTKAGGFGEKDVLIQIDKYLKEKGERF